jgi:peptide/nickel transport system permease protein
VAARQRRGLATLGFLAGKVLGALTTLAFVVVFNFFLFRVLPGDPAKTFTRNQPSTTERLAEIRRSYGFDQPLIEQFRRYLVRLVQGDLDRSYRLKQPVADIILDRLWPTVLLMTTSVVLAAAIGLWLGARGGWRRGTAFDHLTTNTSLAFYAMPESWLGLMLLVLLTPSGLFPTGGMRSPGLDPWSAAGIVDLLWHMALPCVTLTLIYLAQYTLVMRSSILEERRADYLTTARAKGLRDQAIMRRHALPNALLPSVTLIFLSLGFVVSGAITVETAFSWQGLGNLSYEALRGPDIPLLQGLFLVFSVGVIGMNLIADLLLPVLDPRVRPS